jgi:hypothetical protein
MNYEIGPVILPSQDKNRMLDFLSEVLEFEFNPLEDSATHGVFLFKILEGTLENRSMKSVEFNFKVNSEDELEEIARKYNFFIYRKSDSNFLMEKIFFSTDNNIPTLTIEDIDQRLWRFQLSPPGIQ